MSKARNKTFAGVIHHSTMVDWVWFGYALKCKEAGIDLRKAAEEFCASSLINDDKELKPEHLRVYFYRVLKRLMDARSQSTTSDSSEQGAAGNSGGIKTWL